jgi:hypothetical protein
MAVTYNATVKNNRLTVMNDAISGRTFTAGSGGAAGKLVIGTSSLAAGPSQTGVLATISTLSNPAFSVSAGVATLSGVPLSTTVSGAGTQTAALASFRTSADADVITGLTVGVGGGFDVQLNSTSLTNGQTVTVTAVSTITHS